MGRSTNIRTRVAFREIFPSPKRIKLQELIRLQEDVALAREDVLVERSKLGSIVEALRSQRIETSTLEGQLMNLLRKFVNEKNGTLSQTIEDTYQQAEWMRQNMSVIEDDFLEAVRDLGGTEWQFMQKERVFYQYQLPEKVTELNSALSQHHVTQHVHPPPPPNSVLLGDNAIIVHDAPPPPPPNPVLLEDNAIIVHDAPPPPPPKPGLVGDRPMIFYDTSPSSPPPSALIRGIQDSSDGLLRSKTQEAEKRYQSAIKELDDLRREFDSLRPRQSEFLEQECERDEKSCKCVVGQLGCSDLEERYSDVLSRLSECEVKVQRLRLDTELFNVAPAVLHGKESDPVPEENQTFVVSRGFTEKQPEAGVGEGDLSRVQLRVREWLLEHFKNDPLARRTFSNNLEMNGMISAKHSLEELPSLYKPSTASDRSPVSVYDDKVKSIGGSIGQTHLLDSMPRGNENTADQEKHQHRKFSGDVYCSAAT